MDTLRRLQHWFHSRCNGDWEHDYGVEIGTLDNPGWSVAICLAETPLIDKDFPKLERNYGHPSDWLICWVAEERFHAACGPLKLEEAFEVFLMWAEDPAGT